jgi:hypothetical protein
MRMVQHIMLLVQHIIATVHTVARYATGSSNCSAIDNADPSSTDKSKLTTCRPSCSRSKNLLIYIDFVA